MKSNMFIYFGSLFFLGCSTYMEQVVYKPAPATYQEWSKSGASTLDIKKSLLACGKPSPDISFEIYEKVFNISRYDEMAYMNKLALEGFCMERAGYKYNGLYNPKKTCSLEKYKNVPACQPDAVIPTPSVERRLNSWYCKIKTDYDYCLKNALAPQLCNPEEIKTPPPECLADGQAQFPISQTNSSTQIKPRTNTYIPPDRMQQQTIQLQRDTQNQNNRQMNNMLKSTAPKILR